MIMTKETYEDIKNDKYFCPYNWCGDDVDDAFQLGYDFALAEIKYSKNKEEKEEKEKED